MDLTGPLPQSAKKIRQSLLAINSIMVATGKYCFLYACYLFVDVLSVELFFTTSLSFVFVGVEKQKLLLLVSTSYVFCLMPVFLEAVNSSRTHKNVNLPKWNITFVKKKNKQAKKKQSFRRCFYESVADNREHDFC